MIDTRFLRACLTLMAAVLVIPPCMPSGAEAQQAGARARVLVANLTPTDGTRPRFGEETANRLRGLLDLDTHVAMSSRDIDQAARQFDLRLNNLDCTLAQQLAAQIQVPLVFCGEYRTEGGLIAYSGKFVTVPGAEEFAVEPPPIAENQDRPAAEAFLQFFNETRERLAQIRYCLEDANSQNWEGAVDYCVRAVELAPTSKDARTALARSLMELERYESSLEHFEILLEQDPYSSNVLESAGWVSAQLGQKDRARDYYGRYLELNPGNVPVRIQIANDLAQSGDDLGAMRLLEVGFEQDPNNPDLHLQYGAMAFRAAQTMEAERMQPGAPADAPLDPEVAELYRTAVKSLEVVLEDRGAEMRPGDIVNMLRAYVKVGEIHNAVALGERVVQFFRENPQVLGELAATYNRAGRIDDAVQWMERALELQPDLPNARIRMAQLMLGADRIPEAIAWARRAAEAREAPADQIGGTLFAHGWNERVSKGDRETGIRLFAAAKEIPGITPSFRSQVNFFHGVTLYQPRDAALRQDASLQACEAHMPGLREALQYLEDGRTYAQQAGQNVAQFIEATNVWVNDVCDAVIRRAAPGG